MVTDAGARCSMSLADRVARASKSATLVAWDGVRFGRIWLYISTNVRALSLAVNGTPARVTMAASEMINDSRRLSSTAGTGGTYPSPETLTANGTLGGAPPDASGSFGTRVSSQTDSGQASRYPPLEFRSWKSKKVVFSEGMDPKMAPDPLLDHEFHEGEK